LKLKVPLFVTFVFVPSVPAVPPAPICNVPALIVGRPVNVFAAVRMTVPLPLLFNPPAP